MVPKGNRYNGVYLFPGFISKNLGLYAYIFLIVPIM